MNRQYVGMATWFSTFCRFTIWYLATWFSAFCRTQIWFSALKRRILFPTTVFCFHCKGRQTLDMPGGWRGLSLQVCAGRRGHQAALLQGVRLRLQGQRVHLRRPTSVSRGV
jgi:hypothetical protein